MQPRNIFKVLTILHRSMLLGLVLLAAAAFFVAKKNDEADNYESLEMVLQGVAALVSIVMLVVGFGIFRRRLPVIRTSMEPAEKKMEKYLAACILWWAMIDGPGLFSLICFMLTGNYAFLALGLFHAGLLAIFLPRKDNIIMLLNLTSDEVQRVERGA